MNHFLDRVFQKNLYFYLFIFYYTGEIFFQIKKRSYLCLFIFFDSFDGNDVQILVIHRMFHVFCHEYGTK